MEDDIQRDDFNRDVMERRLGEHEAFVEKMRNEGDEESKLFRKAMYDKSHGETNESEDETSPFANQAEEDMERNEINRLDSYPL